MIRVARPESLPPADARLVVVEASAGTGKTYFLEHRVADLVIAGVELEQILLVTFTEKAVAELRLRIRDLLDRLSRASVSMDGDGPCWEIDEVERRRLRAAVTTFDQAPIHTIHGFCHRVLVEDAFAAQRMFEQTQVADEVAFDAAFVALLRERFARVSPDRDLLSAFLETGKTVHRLRDVLLGCARAGRDARIRRRLEPDAVQAAVAGMRARFGTEARRNIVEVALNERRWVPDWLADIGRALDRCAEITPPPQLVAMIDTIREPIELLLKRAARLPPEAAAALRAAASTITLDEAVAAQLLPPLIERIAVDKDERGLFDYDDMLQLVWRALCGPRREALAGRLRERTPHVMIDEFQDTDPIQWNIFRAVWMHADAKGLTIVGDPKQAIYGFRGADVQTYVAAREEMLRAGAVRVPLTVNRRSTPQLVDAVNQILVGNPIAPLLDRSIRYDEPVRASGDVTSSDPRPPITVFQMASPMRPAIDQVRSALQTAIGDAIEVLRRTAPAWTVNGTAQPFSLSQVMVLARTNRDSTEIAAALRSRGMPCALVEPERLFETREASELQCVLAAIAAPRDRAARLRALRTRFFDVPWAELQQAVDAPDHHPQIARIFDWAQLAARRAYESLFRRLVDDSRYVERTLVLGGGERALTNTWHLIELLLAEVSRSRCDLHELALALRRWIFDRTHPDDRDAQRVETDGDAIRVLTVHKAKGLEAAHVFLYGGTSGGPKSGVHRLSGAGRGVTLVVGKPDEETERLIDDEATAENQRLAYVALTRARVRLYLPLYDGSVMQKNAAYQPIQRCLAPFAGPRIPAGVRNLFETIPIEIGLPDKPPAPPDALAEFAPPAAPVIAELGELPPMQRGLTMVSYTRLAHDIDIATVPMGEAPEAGHEIDPAEFDVDDAPASASLAADAQIVVGPGELPPGASSGLLLHDVLEVADLEQAARARDVEAWMLTPEIASAFQEAATARGVASRFIPHAAKLAYEMLTQPLALIDTDGPTNKRSAPVEDVARLNRAGTVAANTSKRQPTLFDDAPAMPQTIFDDVPLPTSEYAPTVVDDAPTTPSERPAMFARVAPSTSEPAAIDDVSRPASEHAPDDGSATLLTTRRSLSAPTIDASAVTSRTGGRALVVDPSDVLAAGSISAPLVDASVVGQPRSGERTLVVDPTDVLAAGSISAPLVDASVVGQPRSEERTLLVDPTDLRAATGSMPVTTTGRRKSRSAAPPVAPDPIDAARASIAAMLPSMTDATAVAREVEFSYPIPVIGASGGMRRGLVRGYIDALIAYGDELWVLDYKSDALAGPDLAAAALHRVRQHYEIQARLYAIAADRLRGKRRLAGMLFAFLRYGIVVPMYASEERIEAWTDWLARIAVHAAPQAVRA